MGVSTETSTRTATRTVTASVARPCQVSISRGEFLVHLVEHEVPEPGGQLEVPAPEVASDDSLFFGTDSEAEAAVPHLVAVLLLSFLGILWMLRYLNFDGMSFACQPALVSPGNVRLLLPNPRVEWCVDRVRARGCDRQFSRLGPPWHTHQLAGKFLHVALPVEKGVSFQP